MKSTIGCMSVCVALLLSVSNGVNAANMGTEITYQGNLTDGGGPVTGQVDMKFTLFDAATLGNQVGTTAIFDGQGGNGAPVDVADGLLTVSPDFGANVFDGTALWLEIEVRNPHDATDTALYDTLDPRQPLTAVPIALQTKGIFVEEPSGNVGIGTTTPSAALDVVGTTELNGDVTINSNLTVDTDALFVDGTNGRVGIGTTTPQERLDIDDGVNSAIRFGTGGTGPSLIYKANQGGTKDLHVVFEDSVGAQTEVMTLIGNGSTGNVGIGTTTPSSQLSVAGDADFTGNVGIGTTTPSSQLSVAGDADFTGNVGIGTASSAWPLDLFGLMHMEGPFGTTYIEMDSGSGGGPGIAKINYIDRGNLKFVSGLHIRGSDNIFKTTYVDNFMDSGVWIDESGNVGIGDFSGQDPSAALDVLGPTELDGDVTAKSNLTVNSNLTVDTDTLFVDGTNDRVGLGTTTPERILHTVGDAILIERDTPDPAVGLRNTSDGTIQGWVGLNATATDDGHMYMTDQDAVKTLFVKDNKVGIRTASPSVALDVVGQTKLNSTTTINGALNVNSAITGGPRLVVTNNHPIRCRDDTLRDIFSVSKTGRVYAGFIDQEPIPQYNLGYSETGFIVMATSSRRYKENIEPFVDDFDLILQTELKQWTGKDDDSGRIGFGFIGEEIEEMGLENLVLYNKEGQVESLKFNQIPFYTLEVVKRHAKEIQALQSQVATLQSETGRLSEATDRQLAEKDVQIAAVRSEVAQLRTQVAEFASLQQRLTAIESSLQKNGEMVAAAAPRAGQGGVQ